MVSKTIKYETEPFTGGWMNKMLLASAVSSLSPLEDEAVLTTHIWSNYVLNEMEFTHLHRTASPYDPPLPPTPNRQEGLTDENISTELDLGYSMVIIASHGFYEDFEDMYGDIYDIDQANASKNFNMPFLFYGDACTTSSYDIGDSNIGEILIKKQFTSLRFVGSGRITSAPIHSKKVLNAGHKLPIFGKETFITK